MNNWAQSVLYWNLALDQNFGPHNGGCGNCRGIVTIHTDQQYRFTTSPEYYNLGQVGKFSSKG